MRNPRRRHCSPGWGEQIRRTWAWECFPARWPTVTTALGSGLQELLDDQNAMEEARVTTDIGLLTCMDVSNGQPQAIARRLLAKVVALLRIATG